MTSSEVSNVKELRKILSGSVIIFLGKIINAVSQYILILMLGRFLGPAEVGLFFIGRAIMRFTNISGTLGFPGSLLKFVPEYMVKKQYYSVRYIIDFAYVSTFCLSLLFSLVLYSVSFFLSNNIFKDQNLTPVIKLFSMCLPLFAIFTITIASIRSFRDMFSLSMVENIIFPAGSIVTALFIFNFYRSLSSFIVAYAIGIIMAIIFGFYFLQKSLPIRFDENPSKISKGHLINFSLPFMGSGIIGFSLMWMDSFMLGYFTSMEEVGIYNGAARIALFSNIILASVNTVFGPSISKYFATDDLNNLKMAYKTTVRWIIHISLPFYLFIFFLSEKIMGLYGTQFIAGSYALIILSFGQLVNISVGSAGYLLTMTGNPKTELLNQIITVVLNFSLNWYLIPLMGINGAALATTVSIVIVNGLRLFENYSHLRIQPFSIQIVWPFSRK